MSMNNNKSILSSKKRKRSTIEKKVRFDIEHIVIVDTYSASEYERGSSSTFNSQNTIKYKLNPNIPKLSLNILPSSPTSSSSPSPSSDIESPTHNKRPKLTINTSICNDGPLFFTKLSTNHFKHQLLNDDDYSNDYLIPITPLSATTPAFTF